MLADNVKKTCYKWVVDNYTYNDKINIITILTTNLRSEIYFNKNNFILICHCQVFKINDPDKNNINNVNQDTVAS